MLQWKFHFILEKASDRKHRLSNASTKLVTFVNKQAGVDQYDAGHHQKKSKEDVRLPGSCSRLPHIMRVYKNAKMMGRHEGTNMEINRKRSKKVAR